MYKTKDTEEFCIITRLKMAKHDLAHAQSGIASSDLKRVAHYIEEACDDIDAVIDYARGHCDGHEKTLEHLVEGLKELMMKSETKRKY